MLSICLLFAITVSILAQEEATRVNKLRNRTPLQQPWIKMNIDNVRCFCNLPRCVATGYLCKSNSGCFSDFEQTRFTAGRHGCLEFLPGSQQASCLRNIDNSQVRSRPSPVCCTSDLCNHVDSPNAKVLLNNTYGEEESVRKLDRNNQEELLYSNSEVWFRAATIAVPICGAVILFVLIALAVKILKKEHQNNLERKLSTAMYVLPTEQKNVYKWSSQKYTQYVCRNPYYSQAFAPRPEDQTHHRIEIPLVRELKNSTNSMKESKNQKSSTSDALILEIEKDLLQLENNPNITENSQDKIYHSEKSFKL